MQNHFVVGWGYGTYETYGTYGYGTRGREDYFVGDKRTMGQHHAPRTVPESVCCWIGLWDLWDA